LTGVSTRRHFFEKAGAALRATEEHDAPFSLVIFDLDGFKLINDTFGHAVGDHVLQLFSRVAVARLRPADIIGRLGGEEFAVAMPGYSPQAAYVVADRIRQAFAGAGFKANGQAVTARVSGGVAAADPMSSLDNLIEQADGALYRAKTLGRDRIEMASRPDAASKTGVVIRVA
jgi:diguanylate cyclase (GGDEF)-like protein